MQILSFDILGWNLIEIWNGLSLNSTKTRDRGSSIMHNSINKECLLPDIPPPDAIQISNSRIIYVREAEW